MAKKLLGDTNNVDYTELEHCARLARTVLNTRAYSKQMVSDALHCPLAEVEEMCAKVSSDVGKLYLSLTIT